MHLLSALHFFLTSTHLYQLAIPMAKEAYARGWNAGDRLSLQALLVLSQRFVLV
jgi:hypothetical protein